MSLFDELRSSVEEKAEKKVKYINIPKFDGKVEDTPENREIVEAVKKAGVGNGVVLSSSYFTSADNFDIYKFQLLKSCYDRRLEEEYLFSRTYYGITTNTDLIPEVKYFLTGYDEEEALQDGKWTGKVMPIQSFKEPIELCTGRIQPMSFRLDSAIFRADEKGGIVYELAPNEKVIGIGKNAFAIEKVEVTRTNYAVVTADNQPLAFADDFKDNKSEITAGEQIKFDIERVE